MEIQFVFFLISKLDSPSTLLFPRLLQEVNRKNREEQDKISIHLFISENAIYSLIDPPKYLSNCWIDKNYRLYINLTHWTALLATFGSNMSHSIPSTSRFIESYEFNSIYCQLVCNPTARIFKI